MVLRGIQIQRCGPARCALLTRRAFSHHYPEEFRAGAYAHRGMCVVVTRPIPFILRSEGQRWDGAVHFTAIMIRIGQDIVQHARRTLHWSMRKGGSHVLSLQ